MRVTQVYLPDEASLRVRLRNCVQIAVGMGREEASAAEGSRLLEVASFAKFARNWSH